MSQDVILAFLDVSKNLDQKDLIGLGLSETRALEIVMLRDRLMRKKIGKIWRDKAEETGQEEINAPDFVFKYERERFDGVFLIWPYSCWKDNYSVECHEIHESDLPEGFRCVAPNAFEFNGRVSVAKQKLTQIGILNVDHM